MLLRAIEQEQKVDRPSRTSFFELNISQLEPEFKHPTIFRCFDALKPEDGFYILNDHDPKPLYYQLIAERGKTFTWEYIENGPQRWKILIKKNTAGKALTIGEMVAADIRQAEVFKKYGIDFCCGGKKTLQQACAEKDLDVAVLEQALADAAKAATAPKGLDFNKWELDFLADYIYQQHHQYYYAEDPAIADILAKVANHHGEKFPVLKTVVTLYSNLQQELKTHFFKEERILFPLIKQLVVAKRSNTLTTEMVQQIAAPLQVMEADHDAAGEVLSEINKLTNAYTPPAGACNSFRLLYSKLQALEDDLHQHIHLENNILFPKALQLERELSNKEQHA